MKRLLAIALMALALAACSHPPESGYVVRKVYDDPDHWTTQDPVYMQQCLPQVRSRYVSDGRGGGTTQVYTETVCTQVLSYYQTVQHYDGPHWKFRIRDDKDKKHFGWVDVTEQEYLAKQVGEHWPEAR